MLDRRLIPVYASAQWRAMHHRPSLCMLAVNAIAALAAHPPGMESKPNNLHGQGSGQRAKRTMNGKNARVSWGAAGDSLGVGWETHRTPRSVRSSIRLVDPSSRMHDGVSHVPAYQSVLSPLFIVRGMNIARSTDATKNATLVNATTCLEFLRNPRRSFCRLQSELYGGVGVVLLFFYEEWVTDWLSALRPVGLLNLMEWPLVIEQILRPGRQFLVAFVEVATIMT